MSLIRIKDCISLSLQKEYRVRKYSKKKDACEIICQMDYENYVCVLKYLDGQSIKDTLESNGISGTRKEAIELLADAEQFPGEQCGVEELGPTDFRVIGYGYTGTVLSNNPRIICREHFTGGSCLEESSLTTYVQINNSDILRVYIAKDDLVIDIDADDIVYHKQQCADNEEVKDTEGETSDEDICFEEWDEEDSPKIGVREFYFDTNDDHDEYGREMERDIDSALYDMDQEVQVRKNQYVMLQVVLTSIEVKNVRLSLNGLDNHINKCLENLKETVQENYKEMETFEDKCWDYYYANHNSENDDNYEEGGFLAIAAKVAQMSEEEREKRDETSRDVNAMDWMFEYGEYVEKDPEIVFDEKLFVFSGISKYHEIEEEDDPLVQKVIERGGQYRSRVSGITDYLIVDPRYCGYSKTKEAIKQIENGKELKIILVSDLESILMNSEEDASFERRKAIDYSGLHLEGENCFKSDKHEKETVERKESTTISEKIIEETDEYKLILYGERRKLIVKRTKDTCFSVDKGFDFSFMDELEISDDVDMDLVSLSSFQIGHLEKITLGGKTKIPTFLRDCWNLKELVFLEGRREIEAGALEYQRNLEIVVFPESLVCIGERAFYGCEKIKKIRIPKNVKKIGEEAFGGCSALEEVTFSEGLKYIGKKAFAWCERLRSIHLPEGLASMGWGAFPLCPYESQQIQELSIPSSLRVLRDLYPATYCTYIRDGSPFFSEYSPSFRLWSLWVHLGRCQSICLLDNSFTDRMIEEVKNIIKTIDRCVLKGNDEAIMSVIPGSDQDSLNSYVDSFRKRVMQENTIQTEYVMEWFRIKEAFRITETDNLVNDLMLNGEKINIEIAYWVFCEYAYRDVSDMSNTVQWMYWGGVFYWGGNSWGMFLPSSERETEVYDRYTPENDVWHNFFCYAWDYDDPILPL